MPILRRGLASTLLAFLRLPPIHLQKMIHSIHTCVRAFPHTRILSVHALVRSILQKLNCAAPAKVGESGRRRKRHTLTNRNRILSVDSLERTHASSELPNLVRAATQAGSSPLLNSTYRLPKESNYRARTHPRLRRVIKKTVHVRALYPGSIYSRIRSGSGLPLEITETLLEAGRDKKRRSGAR
jgi:hypothetical protein